MEYNEGPCERHHSFLELGFDRAKLPSSEAKRAPLNRSNDYTRIDFPSLAQSSSKTKNGGLSMSKVPMPIAPMSKVPVPQ